MSASFRGPGTGLFDVKATSPKVTSEEQASKVRGRADRWSPDVYRRGPSSGSAEPDHQSGEAAGGVAAIVQVDDTLNELRVLSPNGEQTIEVVTVKYSLNNVLNNSPILSNNAITL